MASSCVVKYRGLEVLCKPDTLAAFHAGKLPLRDVVLVEQVFADSGRGTVASEAVLRATFGTTDVAACVAAVVGSGEYRLTAKERREATDRLRLQVINYIHDNYVNPESGCQYTTGVIETALSAVRFVIDLNMPADKLVDKYFRQLNDHMRLAVAKGSTVDVKAAILSDAAAAARKPRRTPKAQARRK